MSAPANQLNREQSRALIAASFSPRLRATEAVIVEHVVRQEAERQKRGRVKPAGVPVPSEDQSQAAVMRWWSLACREWSIPECILFAVPNGGKRHPAEAAKLKKCGVRAGVSDLVLMAAHGGYHGLCLEMKRKGNTPTESQRAFQAAVAMEGYAIAVAYSTDEAIQILSDYCEKPETPGSD